MVDRALGETDAIDSTNAEPPDSLYVISGQENKGGYHTFDKSEESEVQGQLTRYPVGSFRELYKLALPIMGSLLSVGLTIFLNRIFLARFSQDAFNAVSEAAMCFMVIEFTLCAFASVSEVLVGKFFGAARYSEVAKPVWTMVWVSCCTSLLFFPIGYYGAESIFAGSSNKVLAKEFFSTLCFFGPIFPLNAALSSFWIGRGKTKFIIVLVACASLLNTVLDPLLIFGLCGLPTLGVKGAAIARGASQLILLCSLFCAFLSRYNRKKYKTGHIAFDRTSFLLIFSYGSSQCLSQFVQCAAWAFFSRIMSLTSREHILASGIADSIYFFFNFAIEGISKASSSVVANLIGAMRYEEIKRVSFAGIRAMCLFGAALAIVLLGMPETIINLFISNSELGEVNMHVLKMSLIWIWCTMMGEALLFYWSGILMALDKARFTLIVSSLFVWALGVTPAYFLSFDYHLPAHYALGSACLYYFCTAIAYYLRVNACLEKPSFLSSQRVLI